MLHLSVIATTLCHLLGCANPKSATNYAPLAGSGSARTQVVGGLRITADPVLAPQRSRDYFDTDALDLGILPMHFLVEKSSRAAGFLVQKENLNATTGAVLGTATRAASGIVVSRRREFPMNERNLRAEEVESMVGMHAGTAAIGANWIRGAFSVQTDFATLTINHSPPEDPNPSYAPQAKLPLRVGLMNITDEPAREVPGGNRSHSPIHHEMISAQ